MRRHEERHTEKVSVRFTLAQLAHLRDLAWIHGNTLAGYIRHVVVESVLSQAEKGVTGEDLELTLEPVPGDWEQT